MGMGMGCKLELTQNWEGATQTIFPNAEEMLNGTHYQKALEFIAARKRMDRYRTAMDFLACEVFTELRRSCLEYYADEGPQLKGILTKGAIKKIDRRLCLALKLAYRIRHDFGFAELDVDHKAARKQPRCRQCSSRVEPELVDDLTRVLLHCSDCEWYECIEVREPELTPRPTWREFRRRALAA